MSGKLFCVRFDSNLFIGLLSGIAMLLLSFGMNCFPGTVFSVLFLRSILMIFVLGFLYPLYMILFRENQSFSVKISIPLENTGVSSVFATSVWPFSLIFSLARRNEGNFFQAVPTTLSSSLAEVRLASLVAWA